MLPQGKTRDLGRSDRLWKCQNREFMGRRILTNSEIFLIPLCRDSNHVTDRHPTTTRLEKCDGVSAGGLHLINCLSRDTSSLLLSESGFVVGAHTAVLVTNKQSFDQLLQTSVPNG